MSVEHRLAFGRRVRGWPGFVFQEGMGAWSEECIDRGPEWLVTKCYGPGRTVCANYKPEYTQDFTQDQLVPDLTDHQLIALVENHDPRRRFFEVVVFHRDQWSYSVWSNDVDGNTTIETDPMPRRAAWEQVFKYRILKEVPWSPRVW